jgi:hypothetical protein
MRLLEARPEFRRHVLEVLRQPPEESVSYTDHLQSVLDLAALVALATRTQLSPVVPA